MNIAETLRGTIFEDIIWWWKIQQLKTKTVHVEVKHGEFNMDIPIGTNFERQLGEQGSYEPVLEQALAADLTSETIYFDIGSRWGYFTLLANDLIPNGEVHAFDANPKWFHILQQNHDDDGTKLNNLYISDSSGPRTTTIDDYVLKASIPDVIKIDIEGAEATAVQGMASLLEKHRPILYIEVHPVYLQRYSASASSLLDNLNRIYNITVAPNHRDGESQWVSLDDAVLPDSGDFLIKAQ